MNNFFIIGSKKETILSSLKISLFVGTLLNFINQTDAIIGLDLSKLSIIKVLLTYIIPYLVASYSYIKAKLAFKISDTTLIDAHLDCKNCNKNSIHIHDGELIPVCSNCLEETVWKITK